MVVCDDGSTDNSCEVIASYTKQDSRLRLLSKQNGGIASTLNAAYAVCSGEIICILDADDVYLPGKLSEVLGAFRRFPRSGACFHRILKMRQDGSAFGYAGPVVFSGRMGGSAGTPRRRASSHPTQLGPVAPARCR